MSTATAPPQPATQEAAIRGDGPPPPPRHLRSGEAEFEGQTRTAIRGVTWEFYEHFVDGIPEHSHVRTAFDGKDLEIMSAGYIHEYYRDFLSRLLLMLTLELEIPAAAFGMTTWKRPEVARGLESDECYYFDPEKLETARIAVSIRSYNVADYPNPDCAIEIDISPSQVDRAGIYASLVVREVWRFNGTSLVIERLADGKTYIPAERSEFLHIRPEDVLKWILDPDAWNRLDWSRRLQTWIRAELVPRLNPEPNDPGTGTTQGTESA